MDGKNSSNSGDWAFGTKVWLHQEGKKAPSVGFLYEVKLPNASNEGAGGTDETDFFGFVVLSKQLGEKNSVHGNLGLGILGNPFDLAS